MVTGIHVFERLFTKITIAVLQVETITTMGQLQFFPILGDQRFETKIRIVQDSECLWTSTQDIPGFCQQEFFFITQDVLTTLKHQFKFMGVDLQIGMI